jgi:hypothetical protein
MLPVKEDPNFDAFRTELFERIAPNRARFFNFFVEHNDIFKMID